MGYSVDDVVNRMSRTSFVIAHRMSTIRGADRVVVMDGGRIVESGTHKELLARDGLYACLYRMTYESRPSGQSPSTGSGQAESGDGNGQRPGEPAPKPLPAG